MEYSSLVPKSSAQLKRIAKEKLKGNWVSAIVVCVVVIILTNGINLSYTISDTIKYGRSIRTGFNLGDLLQLILGGPMALGMTSYFMNLIRDEDTRIEDTFSGFKNFASAFLVQLLAGIFVLLWTILLIIPGIIAALSYSMIYYILKDNPDLSAMDVIRESKKLMDGEKGRLFILGLSFIGWIIVGIITAGIGFLWIGPYINAAMAAFYEDLKERKLVNHEKCQPNDDIYIENP